MDKEKCVGGLLPPSGNYSLFLPSGSSYSVKSEPSGSSNLPPLGPVPASELKANQFSHDISRMPDNPPKNLGHRRAHSEILTLPDDISFDSDLGVVGGLDGPSLSDETEEDFLSMYLDMDNLTLHLLLLHSKWVSHLRAHCKLQRWVLQLQGLTMLLPLLVKSQESDISIVSPWMVQL